MNNTLLIIEDNAQNFYMMKFLLQKNDYTIFGAEDGYKGIELALKLIPDAILLDIQLPGISGYEVAARLKELRELDQTPIIVVTSYAMEGDRENAFKAGADGYIEKPIDPDTFVSTVKKYIQAGKLH